MPPRRRADLVSALGSRIRALREEAGLTQETLAWDSELAKAYLSQVEAGKRTPSISALFALAERLGVEAADLLSFNPKAPRLLLLEATRLRDAQAVADALRQLQIPVMKASRRR